MNHTRKWLLAIFQEQGHLQWRKYSLPLEILNYAGSPGDSSPCPGCPPSPRYCEVHMTCSVETPGRVLCACVSWAPAEISSRTQGNSQSEQDPFPFRPSLPSSAAHQRAPGLTLDQLYYSLTHLLLSTYYILSTMPTLRVQRMQWWTKWLSFNFNRAYMRLRGDIQETKNRDTNNIVSNR